MPTCRVCKRDFTYNDEVGYDKELCGPMCDGIEAGRRGAVLMFRDLAKQIEEKALQDDGEAGLAFTCCASSIRRVCDEVCGT